MKRRIFSVATSLSLALGLWAAHVPNVMAANPTYVVIFVCEDFSPYTVVSYSNSYDAPGQTSGASCSQQLEDLLTAGFTNVNVSLQTYTAASGLGAPGSLDGTYITYVLANGTLTGGNL
jgi:hypothetical protein